MVQSRLLDTAIREFGLYGLDGASTRAIAAHAGTAMSSITYHFGGKEGLYLAAADHVADRMGTIADDLDIEGVIEMGDPTRAQAMLIDLLDRFAERVAAAQTEALFIVREQMNPTEAFDRIYRGPMEGLYHDFARLVGAATGEKDERRCRIVAMTLFGQVIVIRSARAGFERLLGETLDDRAVLDDIKAMIAANTGAIVDRMKREAGTMA